MEVQCCPITFASSGQKQRKCCRRDNTHPPTPPSNILHTTMPKRAFSCPCMEADVAEHPLLPLPIPSLSVSPMSKCFAPRQKLAVTSNFYRHHTQSCPCHNLAPRTAFVVLMFSSPVTVLCDRGANLLSGGLSCLVFGPC